MSGVFGLRLVLSSWVAGGMLEKMSSKGSLGEEESKAFEAVMEWEESSKS